MRTRKRPSGGEFDPISATSWKPVRSTLASGEATAVRYAKFHIHRIKSPRALYTQERLVQGHAQSTSDLVIETGDEAHGDELTPDMIITHRRWTYQIRGILRTDFASRTTLYQVTQINDFPRS